MLFGSDSDEGTTIEISGENVRELNPDERTAALCIQRALLSNSHARVAASERVRAAYVAPETLNVHKPGSIPKSLRNQQRTERKAREKMITRIDKAASLSGPPRGFTIHRGDDLHSRIKSISGDGDVYMLHEDGMPLWDALDSAPSSTDQSSPPPATIVLGDQNGFSPHDEQALSSVDARRVNIGPLSLLTSQAITISHHYLDRYVDDSNK